VSVVDSMLEVMGAADHAAEGPHPAARSELASQSLQLSVQVPHQAGVAKTLI